MVKKTVNILKDWIKAFSIALCLSLVAWGILFAFSSTWGEGKLAKAIIELFSNI